MFEENLSGLKRRMESTSSDRKLLKELSFVVFVLDQEVSQRFRDSTLMHHDLVQIAGSQLMSQSYRRLRDDLVDLIKQHPEINHPDVGHTLTDLRTRVRNIPEPVISRLTQIIVNDEFFNMHDYLNYR